MKSLKIAVTLAVCGVLTSEISLAQDLETSEKSQAEASRPVVVENLPKTSWSEASNFELRTAFYLRAAQATAVCVAQGAIGTAEAIASQLPIAPKLVTQWQQQFDQWMYAHKAPQLRRQMERNGCPIRNENVERMRDQVLDGKNSGQGEVAAFGGGVISVIFDLGKGVYQLATVPYDGDREYFETFKTSLVISQTLIARHIGVDSACGHVVESMKDIVAEMRHRGMVEFKTGLQIWDEPKKINLICPIQ